MAKNPGIIYEIIEGSHAGQFAFAPHDWQAVSLLKNDMVLVQLFSDRLLQKPIVSPSLAIRMTKLKTIGFSD